MSHALSIGCCLPTRLISRKSHIQKELAPLGCFPRNDVFRRFSRSHQSGLVSEPQEVALGESQLTTALPGSSGSGGKEMP